ncbi:hypothetical protein BH18ACT7_BH18ACT7_11000 [soil metagenome]
MSRARCEVIPGPGSVARRRDSLLWASAQTPESVWDTLVACLGLGARATASAAVLQGLAETMLPSLDADTAFAVLVSDGTTGFLLRHGAVDLLVDDEPVTTGPVSSVIPGVSVLLGSPQAVRSAAEQAPAYRHDLDGGVVPGGAVRWAAVTRADGLSAAVPALPPSVPTEPPVPSEPPVSSPGPVAVEPVASDTGAEPTSDPKQTEFHPPPDPDAPPSSGGFRANAGVLVFEDGATISLAGDVVLGRRPDNHELVVSGQAQPVVINDPDHVLSGAHAAIRFHGDEVVVVDLDSLNGTHVASPEAREWTRLTPGAPFLMQDGFRMLLGWTVLTSRR